MLSKNGAQALGFHSVLVRYVIAFKMAVDAGHGPIVLLGDEVEDDGVQLVDGGSEVVVDDGLVEIAGRLAESDLILGRGEPALKRLFRLGPTTTQATLRDG